MPVALITTNPFALVNDPVSLQPMVFPSIPNPLRLPNGLIVEGIPSLPWVSQDGQFSLVNVPAFVPTGGQVISGPPAYAINTQTGAVSQSFTTVAAPIVSMQLQSTGNPTLNGTYGLDPGTQTYVLQVSHYIVQNSAFPAGRSTMPILDSSGNAHVFGSTAGFQVFAKAYFDFLIAVQLGGTPSQPVTIP